MASGPKRQLSDSIDPLPASLDILPVHSHPSPTGVISTQVVPTPSATLPLIATSTSQAAQVEPSATINALQAVLGGLGDSLAELPPLQTAIDSFRECTVHLQLDEQNREAYDELALNLAKLAEMLQKHVAILKLHHEPDSVANVARGIKEQAELIKAQRGPLNDPLTVIKDNGKVVLNSYRRIGALFQQLQTDILLSLRDELTERDIEANIKDLSPVYDAYYNAALPTSVTKRVGCTRGTRIKLLEEAQDWTRGGNPAKVYWLNGMAGTGKTTIAYTLCEILEKDKLLGASFFCSRNSADCQDVNLIVPTIAYQLAQYSNPYRQQLFQVLKTYSDASKRDIGAQFMHLILKPFENIGQEAATSQDIVVVIDALDECADEAGTKIVLDMLVHHTTNLPLKFFVASRPEPAISHSMEARDGALRSIVWLHDIEESLVQADIRLTSPRRWHPSTYPPPRLTSLSIEPAIFSYLRQPPCATYYRIEGRCVTEERRDVD